MIFRTLLLFLALLPLSSPLQAAWWGSKMVDYFKGAPKPEAPSIRVLLLHDVKDANLEVRGKYSLYDPYTNNHISTRVSGKNRKIQAGSDGLKWGEAFPGLYQIKIKGDEGSALTMVNDHVYGGDVFVYDVGGTISIVNQISVEDYVRSILVAYQNKYLEPETLAALAIIVRTNAYFQAAKPKNTYWAIDAQRVNYRGEVPGSALIDDAVKMTRYMIMSRTGVYEKVATPFPAQIEGLGTQSEKTVMSQLSLEEINAMAEQGEDAGQILAKAFPDTTIMLMEYSN